MSLLKSATTIGSYTLLSRVLGFIRDILIATRLGAGPLADAFFVAFKLPNLFRRLFAEGAFGASFVPIFASKVATEEHHEAKLFAENVLGVLLAILMALTILFEIFMPWVMKVFAPGFLENPEQFEFTVLIARIMFPYLLCISICSFCAAILNSLKRFAAGAFVPVLLNICMIIGILYVAKYTKTSAHALTYSVAVAGLIQMVWMLIAVRRAGMKFTIRRPRLTSQVKLVLKRMVPGMIGAGIVQLNVWIDVILATLIPGAVSFLYYADRLNQFPLAIIGTAMGTALLPSLSRQIKEDRKDDIIKSQNQAIGYSLLLTLPAAAAFMIISYPIIATMFEYGAFSQESAKQTAAALAVYSIGLPAFVLIKVLSPNFFAAGDTKTPVKVASFCVLLNIILSLALIGPLKHVGLALATSIVSWINVVMLTIILRKRETLTLLPQLITRLTKAVIATAVMAFVIWQLKEVLEINGQMPITERVTLLAGLILSGIASFTITAQVIGACDIKEMIKSLKKKPLSKQ